jgi:spoIIIJ-associated protein
MEESVEFSGKDVDDAIANACKHFGIERDKLEIEIISGGSSGIFGLVGVKKARVLARKRGAVEDSGSLEAHQESAPVEMVHPVPAKKPGPAKPQPRPKAEPRKKPVPGPDQVQTNAVKEKPDQGQHKKNVPVPDKETVQAPDKESVKGPDKESVKGPGKAPDIETDRDENNDIPDLPAGAGSDDPELREYVHGLMVHLTEPLSPGAEIFVNDQSKPISVVIKDKTTSEVLIGRDGQTLSAIQYIANRIIAKNRPGAARVQLDTEDFLEKQNEKLQENAFLLATKAKKIGKTMSTRPLSSYHRRIVHMALQSDKKIRTKSKGDGPMKRVLIMPKQRRKKPSQE